MATSTHVFGAADAKISPLTSDSGLAPVYGTAIDVPGLKSIEIKGSSSTKELRGDNQPLESISILESIEVTLNFAKWDPSIYAIMTGSVVTEDAGSYRVAMGATSKPQPFKVQAISAGATGSASNVDIIIYKLTATDLPDMVGLAEEDFKTVSVTCKAVPLASTGEWLEWGYNETAITL